MRLIDILKEARKKEEKIAINENLGSKKNLMKRKKIINQKKAREARRLKNEIKNKLNIYNKKLTDFIMNGKIDQAIEYVNRNEKLKEFLLASIEAQGLTNILKIAKNVYGKNFNKFKKFVTKLTEEN